MIKRILITFIISLVIVSCGKNSGDANPSDKNSVTIGGKAYKTVVIGSQIWTAENYSGAGGYSNAATAMYGSYFKQSEALAIPLPAGWRLPTLADYNKLTSNITTDKGSDGNYWAVFNSQAAALAATTGWSGKQGTNTLGFNGMNSGHYTVRSAQVLFAAVGSGFYVTADAIPITSTAYAQYGYQLDPGVAGIIHNSDPEELSYSVRFVKDK